MILIALMWTLISLGPYNFKTGLNTGPFYGGFEAKHLRLGGVTFKVIRL